MDDRRLGDELDRVVELAELDEATDDVELVRELVGLRPQCLEQAALGVELPQRTLELGAVAERHDSTDLVAANDRGHAVRDENAPAREDDLVRADRGPVEHIANAALWHEIAEQRTLDGHRQAQQPPRFVVRDRDVPGHIEGEDALADPVQHRATLLEETNDLARAQAERLPVDAPSEDE